MGYVSQSPVARDLWQCKLTSSLGYGFVVVAIVVHTKIACQHLRDVKHGKKMTNLCFYIL